MNTRIEHIDIAKGLSIFLVALYHSNLPDYANEIIGPMSLFRMPLFFFLSGVFFSWTIKTKPFLLKKSEALLKPYFSVLIVLLLVGAVSGEGDIFWRFKGIFYGNGNTIDWDPLWFLTHLFSIYVFSYILFRACKFNQLFLSLKIILLLVMMLIGSLFIQLFWYQDVTIFGVTKQLPGLPFSIDLILITSVYFICGYLLKIKLIAFKPRVDIFLILSILFILISAYTDAHTELNVRVYDNPFFATLGAFCGIYMVISISWVLSKKKWLSYLPHRLGGASLYILIFHYYIYHHSYLFLSEGVKDESTIFYISVFSFVLSVSVPLAIKVIIVKSDILSLAFLPFESNKLLQRS